MKIEEKYTLKKCEDNWTIYDAGEEYAIFPDQEVAEHIKKCLNFCEKNNSYKNMTIKGRDLAGMIVNRHLSTGKAVEIPESNLRIFLDKIK